MTVMRTVLCVALILFSGVPPATAVDVHHFANEDLFAGCLFGDIVPLLRRGYTRDRALEAASRRCEFLSGGMTKRQVQEVTDYVNASIDLLDR